MLDVRPSGSLMVFMTGPPVDDYVMKGWEGCQDVDD